MFWHIWCYERIRKYPTLRILVYFQLTCFQLSTPNIIARFSYTSIEIFLYIIFAQCLLKLCVHPLINLSSLFPNCCISFFSYIDSFSLLFCYCAEPCLIVFASRFLNLTSNFTFKIFTKKAILTLYRCVRFKYNAAV
jgi:hypothetical protein